MAFENREEGKRSSSPSSPAPGVGCPQSDSLERPAAIDGRDVRLQSALMDVERSLDDVCQQMGLTMPQLGAIAGDPSLVHRLSGLVRLADLRSQLLLSRFRMNAVIRLLELAADATSEETARKACVDLMRAGVQQPDADPAALAQERPEASDVLAVLEQLGKAAS